jgi:1-acyl-sn-glycerol-3-phosphate acyltransferase
MGPVELARLSRRIGGCLATTAAMWAGLDSQTVVRDPNGRDPLLRKQLTYKWTGRWARQCLRVLDVTIAGKGLYVGTGNRYPGCAPNGRGRIFVMNHRSAIDILVMFATTESYMVSRMDLASWPFMGGAARRSGALFVDRSSMRSGATVLKLMTQCLQQGSGVAIFPEGTAFNGDEVRSFKPGAFRAAQRAGAEIIPLGIAYEDENAYYRDESFGTHCQRVFSLPEVRLAVVTGDPIDPGGRTLVEVRDHARAVVLKLVHEARAQL